VIPYSRQTIDDHDVEAIIAVLHGDWLTTGPHIEEFERGLTGYTGARHAVAFSSGTAALSESYPPRPTPLSSCTSPACPATSHCSLTGLVW
jgi:hypothetical protein